MCDPAVMELLLEPVRSVEDLDKIEIFGLRLDLWSPALGAQLGAAECS